MTDPDRMQAIRLEPGDTILITVPNGITNHHADAMRDDVQAAFPGHPILIISGAELSILRDQEAGGGGGEGAPPLTPPTTTHSEAGAGVNPHHTP